MNIDTKNVIRVGLRVGSLAIALAAAVYGDSNIRINSGGPAYTDAAGNVWAADYGFTGGSTFSTTAAVSNTTDPALYQNERYAAGAPLEYLITAPNGLCTVKLKFAEIYFTAAGQRVFNIVINGATVQTSFDAFAAAGGAYKAIDMSYQVNVTNGKVDLQFVPVVQNAKVNAIEIDVPVTTTPPPATPNFADAETPAGTVNGTNATFTLAHTPNPAVSLVLVRNGLVMKVGVDFTISGNTVTFTGTIPQLNDNVEAFYRY